MAQNLIIQDPFTAYPTARVFVGKMYVCPSHDIYVVQTGGAVEIDWVQFK